MAPFRDLTCYTAIREFWMECLYLHWLTHCGLTADISLGSMSQFAYVALYYIRQIFKEMHVWIYTVLWETIHFVETL